MGIWEGEESSVLVRYTVGVLNTSSLNDDIRVTLKWGTYDGGVDHSASEVE